MGWIKQLACDRCQEEDSSFEAVSAMKISVCVMSSKQSVVNMSELYDDCDLLTSIHSNVREMLEVL